MPLAITATTFPTDASGTGVEGLAYDSGSGTLFAGTYGFAGGCVQMNPLSGAVIATYPTGAYAGGFAMVSDGANIWSTKFVVGDTVSYAPIATGAVAGTPALGTGSEAEGLCFDGINIWVSAASGGGGVTKITAVTGAVVGTYYDSGASSPQVVDVCFDGANIWATVNVYNQVSVFNAATGAVAMGPFACGGSGYGICFDGTYIWVTNSAANTVTKMLASSGAIIASYATGNGPGGVAFDGTYIWVVNTTDNTVTVLVAATGALAATSAAVLNQANWIVWGGASGMWVGNGTGTAGTATVTRFSIGGGAAPASAANVAY